MMKIFDKAAWQIDGGMDKDIVISHFTFIFEWLQAHELLTKDGLEILNIGIDEDASLNEHLVTEDGAKFLAAFYDELIKQSKYDIVLEENLLSLYYEKFKQNNGT